MAEPWRLPAWGLAQTLKVYVTSDLHIGHKLVAAIRDLDPGHDAQLADNWDAVIKSADHVWVLGDISAGGSSGQRNALQWLAQRPGVKHLIAGNHDGCHPMHRDSHKWQSPYLEVFDSVQSAARRRIAGDRVQLLMSHFPYSGDHTEISRYEQWRLRDVGEVLLHGHTHQPTQITRSDSGTLQVHVGVDAWGMAPVSLEEVESLVRAVLQEGVHR